MEFTHKVEISVNRSVRLQQLEAMFDVPSAERRSHEWSVAMPIEDQPWNVGLIVGPSGSGKTQIATRIWPNEIAASLGWNHDRSVIDNFAPDLSMEAIAGICTAVGFNTIPSWMKPFHVLSNGEQFRVTLARRLIEQPSPTVVDEFSSVVDRQVAQICSHAVQKWVRKNGRQFVAVTCHYDVIDWLQPDWIYDVAAGTFTRRLLQRRPAIDCTISPIPYAAWQLFAPFHYLTRDLHRGARCYGLFVGDRLASFAGMLHRPVSRSDAKIMGCSRLVTLPDFQGLGLAFVLIDHVASVYKAIGYHTHTYPAHPALITAFDQSRKWAMRSKPTAMNPNRTSTLPKSWKQGTRPCAVFRYAGSAVPKIEAQRMLSYWSK